MVRPVDGNKNIEEVTLPPAATKAETPIVEQPAAANTATVKRVENPVGAPYGQPSIQRFSEKIGRIGPPETQPLTQTEMGAVCDKNQKEMRIVLRGAQSDSLFGFLHLTIGKDGKVTKADFRIRQSDNKSDSGKKDATVKEDINKIGMKMEFRASGEETEFSYPITWVVNE